MEPNEQNLASEESQASPEAGDEFVQKTLVQSVFSLVAATLTGQKVPVEQMEKRFAICEKCEFYKQKRGKYRCDICGCQLGPNDKSFPNLVAFEETPQYGCFYYAAKRRTKKISVEQRSKWKENGV